MRPTKTENNQPTSLLKIIEDIDELAYFEKCGPGLEDCSDSRPCSNTEDFKMTHDHLKSEFINKSIRELASECRK